MGLVPTDIYIDAKGVKTMTEEELEKKGSTKVNAAIETYGEAPKIDLSKIKNANAAKVEGEFKAKISETATKARKSKFCFTEEHIVPLPTKGILYKNLGDEQVANGEITLRPMSFSDEDILSNQSYIKNGTVFTKLLSSCIVNDIDVRKLAAYDVFYLLYTLRKITYGDDYKFKITCAECKKEYEVEVDISDVEWEEMEDGVEPVATIKLPISKYTITINMPSLGDEEEVNKISKKYDFSDTILNYVVRTVEILDTDGDPINPNDYGDFFQALPGRDRAEITKAFDKMENLTIPMVDIVCPKCHTEDRVSIPFTKEFFRY